MSLLPAQVLLCAEQLNSCHPCGVRTMFSGILGISICSSCKCADADMEVFGQKQ